MRITKRSEISDEMKISALYVVKNSAAFLGYSISAILPHIDEVVVVDEESTDLTSDVVRAIGSPKIKYLYQDMSSKKPGDGLRVGIRYVTGNVILKIDDDWLWDDENAKRLREKCQEAFDNNNHGLECRCYDVVDQGKRYIKECYKPYIKISKTYPFICAGTVDADNLMIYRENEVQRWNHQKSTFDIKMRRRRYLDTDLFFTHWKWVRDTKEYFFHRWTNVFFKERPLQERQELAEKQWNQFINAPRHDFMGSIPETLYRDREHFVPLGGFDILKEKR